MADNEQQMLLVAKLVDQVSDKLKEINKAMLATEAAAKKAHKGSAEAADEHRKSIELLEKSFEQIKEASEELVKPGFAALGIGALSLAGAIGAVVDAVKDLGEQGLALEKTTRRSGLLANSIRELQGIGLRWGVSMEQTNAGLASFGELMDKTARRAPDAMRTWMQMPGLWHALGQSLQGLNRQQQIDKVLDFVVRLPYRDQRRRILQLMGLPEDYANLEIRELEKAREEEHAWVTAHPFAKELAEKADENFTKLKRSFQGLRDDLGAAFGGQVLEGIETINHFLENTENIEKINKAFKGLADTLERIVKQDIEDIKSIWNFSPLGFMKKTPKQLLEEVPTPEQSKKSMEDMLEKFRNRSEPKAKAPWVARGLYNPSSFGEGFSQSDTDRHVEEPIYRAMLRALQEWYQQISGAAPAVSGGGFQKASLNFGGDGYSNLSQSGGGGGGWGSGGGPGSGGANRGGGLGGGGGGGGFFGPFEPFKFDPKTMTEGGIDRSKFAAEVQNNPALVAKMASMVKGEVGLGPRGSQAKQILELETLFNRAQARHYSSLGQDLFHGRGGYYAADTFRSVSPGEVDWFKKNVLAPVMAGSDVGTKFLGSTPTGNASQMGFAGRRLAQGYYSRGRWWGDHPSHDEMFVTEMYDAMRMARQPLPRIGPRQTSGSLLSDGGAQAGSGKDASASVSIDLKNMPSWVRTSVDHNGLFKEFKVNRGFAMPLASDAN